jgi:hypothetical protein
VTFAVRIVPSGIVPTQRRAAVPRGLPEGERTRLRAEFYAVSERLRKLGLSFDHIAAMSGRGIQSVHQGRIRKNGNYPAPPQEIIDDLLQAAEHQEAILAQARALLETLT